MRKIETSVSGFLVDQLRSELDSPEKQQVLFQLLGRGFVVKHFPHHKYDPRILEALNSMQRKRIQDEMKAFVDQKVKEGLNQYQETHEADRKLLSDLREIFSSDLNAELNKKLVKKNKIKVKNYKRRTKIVELEDTMPDRKNFVHGVLKELLDSKNGMDEMVMLELQKRLLIMPSMFRQQLYERIYLTGFSELALKHGKMEYEREIKNQLDKRNIRTVSEWTGRKPVDFSVILAYERSPALREEFEIKFIDKDGDGVDDRLVFYTRVLTIAKMVDNNFSPTHIFWLVWACKYFHTISPDSKEEKALAVAYNFRLFCDVVKFGRSDIFRIAQEVYDILEQEETQFLIDLHGYLQKETDHIDLTLFSQEIYTESDEKTQKILNRFVKNKRVAKEDVHYFADLKLFLRKWISEGFFGSMSANGAALVWDFLFIRRFDEKSIIQVCLTLVHLLKPLMESATDFPRLLRILSDGPKLLLTKDIQRVLKHLSQDGLYDTIPGVPQVPKVSIIPPSARDDRQALDRRINALVMDHLVAEEH